MKIGSLIYLDGKLSQVMSSLVIKSPAAGFAFFLFFKTKRISRPQRQDVDLSQTHDLSNNERCNELIFDERPGSVRNFGNAQEVGAGD
jgi:hypothetical protein